MTVLGNTVLAVVSFASVSAAQTLPPPRSGHVMTTAGPAGGPFVNETWTFDGMTWELADSTTGPGGLVHHAMSYDTRRQRVVMFGGFDNTNRRTTPGGSASFCSVAAAAAAYRRTAI